MLELPILVVDLRVNVFIKLFESTSKVLCLQLDSLLEVTVKV